GSTLNVTSRLGKGSTFTFSLVMATTEQIQSFDEKFVKSAQTVMLKSNDKVDLESNFFAMSEQQIAASNEQHTFVNGQSKKFHLLVVDDDPINLNVMKSILSAEIFNVTTVTSGKKALAILDDQ